MKTLFQMERAMQSFFKNTRGKQTGAKRSIPLEYPIVAAVDTCSKLMTKAEADGFVEYGDHMDPSVAKNAKDSTESNPMVGAKFWHAWARRMAAMTEQNNAVVVLISHQNTKIDFSPGAAQAAMRTMQRTADLRNKTRPGGGALDQSAAYQIIGVKGTDIKNKATGELLGHWVHLRMDKNSYGPNGHEIKFAYHDKDEHYKAYSDAHPGKNYAPLRFHEAFAELLAEKRIMGITGEDGVYDWRDGKMLGVSGEALSRRIHEDPVLRDKVGSLLCIRGYGALAMLEVKAPTVLTEEEQKVAVAIAGIDEAPPPPEDEANGLEAVEEEEG